MKSDRRSFLQLLASVPLLAAGLVPGTSSGTSAASVPPPRSPGRFPERFLWGASTAGHQVEGNNVNSDIWLLEQVKPSLFSTPSGDACDSLHRWQQDMDIAHALGFNAYRFSVEWARIEPEPGQFSSAYLDFYRRMLDGCHARGLTPVVTFSHFTSPRWFAAANGWQNPDAPQLFARYCERLAQRLADGIGYALTFNEPNLPWLGRWAVKPMPAVVRQRLKDMLAAAAHACGTPHFAVLNDGEEERTLQPLLEGHRLGRAAIKSVRSSVPVGMSLAVSDDQATGPDSLLEQKRREVYAPFFEAGRGDDFVGVQTYGRTLVGAKGSEPLPAGEPRTQSGDEYYPAALGHAVTYVHQATGKPVLVTENGIATEDDELRARFIPAVLEGLGQAISQGVPVLGYLHWSLLDNFEWFSGYGPKYGLVAVDRQTFARTPKPSAKVYATLITELSGLR